MQPAAVPHLPSHSASTLPLSRPPPQPSAPGAAGSAAAAGILAARLDALGKLLSHLLQQTSARQQTPATSSELQQEQHRLEVALHQQARLVGLPGTSHSSPAELSPLRDSVDAHATK